MMSDTELQLGVKNQYPAFTQLYPTFTSSEISTQKHHLETLHQSNLHSLAISRFQFQYANARVKREKVMDQKCMDVRYSLLCFGHCIIFLPQVPFLH